MAEQKAAQGDVVTADANLKTAKINLGYTEITAPISGEIGRTKRHQGQRRRAGQRRADDDRQPGPDVRDLPGQPARIPARCRSRSERRQASAGAGRTIRFSDGSTYDQTGRIDFVDVTVDRATDTVLVRATMPNPKGVLIDGQLVRVAVEGGQAGGEGAGAAVGADRRPAGHLCLRGRRTARRRSARVKLGGESGPDAIVDERPEGRRAGGRAGHGKPAPWRRRSSPARRRRRSAGS